MANILFKKNRNVAEKSEMVESIFVCFVEGNSFPLLAPRSRTYFTTNRKRSALVLLSFHFSFLPSFFLPRSRQFLGHRTRKRIPQTCSGNKPTNRKLHSTKVERSVRFKISRSLLTGTR